eukprot:6456565-Amphidinium_carterae.1
MSKCRVFTTFEAMFRHWTSCLDSLPFKPTSCLKLLGTEIHWQGSCRCEQSAYKAKHTKALRRLQRVAVVPTSRCLRAKLAVMGAVTLLAYCPLRPMPVVDVRAKFRTALLRSYMGKVRSVADAPESACYHSSPSCLEVGSS